MDVNRYAYANNDPVNLSDPNGHQTQESKSECDKGKKCEEKPNYVSSQYILKEWLKGIAEGTAQGIVDFGHAGAIGMGHQYGADPELSLSSPPELFGKPSSYWNVSGREIAPAIGVMLGGKYSGKTFAARQGVSLTKVGRWMSRAEFEAMQKTGRVQTGSGGVTYVTTGGPQAFKGFRSDSVYAEFKVPTNSIVGAGRA